ncbi:MAG: substrate-binding domain-containing protein, partial [Lawsonibacter sp.]|nr:substrate-binding domain-containing protein [Lawsonibacter sp.]
MKKRMIALALALTLALSLTACGGGSTSTPGTVGSNPASTSGSNPGSTSTPQDAGEFNPDYAADAMTIEELRAANGVEVTVPANAELAVVMKSLSNEFWRTLEEGYQQAASDAGITIEVNATTSENDEILQQTMTENFTTGGKTALMLSPISDSNLTSAVESANAAGVLTVNVNDGLIAQANHYVGPNAAQNGELAAAWLSEKLGDQGEVAIVIGMPKAFAARQRTAGFKQWIADNNSGLTVVEEQNADWDRNQAKTIAANWIQNHPDLKGIFCNNDTMAL